MTLGLALRLVQSDDQALWSDEALTLILAKWPAGDLMTSPVDPTGGLYYLLHKWLIPDDAGLVAIRGISIAAGVLSIGAIYWTGRLAIGRSAGLLAAALLTLSPVLVDYSQEARVYSLQLLLVLVSAAGLLAWDGRLGGKGGGLSLAVFGIATVLAFSAHLASIFWVIPAVPLAFWATFRRGTRLQKRMFLACAGLMALGAIPELYRLLWRVSLGGGFNWLAQADPMEFLATLGRVLLPFGPWTLESVSLATVFAALVLIGWRVAAHRDAWQSWAAEHEMAAGVIAIMLFAPVGVWLIGFILVPIFMPRTILIAVPGLILLLALTVHLERKPWLAPSLMLLFACSLLLTGLNRTKEDWRAVAANLQSGVRAGDVILACPDWKYPALRHALTKPLSSPVIAALGSTMVRMDRTVTDSTWIDRYFRSASEPVMRARMKQPVPSRTGTATLPAFRRAWVVESECSPGQRRAVRTWLAQGQWTLAVDSPATDQRAGIRLWRVDTVPMEGRPILVVDD